MPAIPTQPSSLAVSRTAAIGRRSPSCTRTSIARCSPADRGRWAVPLSGRSRIAATTRCRPTSKTCAPLWSPASAGLPMPSCHRPAPGTFGRDQNRYYKTQEEFLFALADALRVEYRAISDAGFILQIDDPGMAENWDAMDPSVTIEEYRGYARLCIEALNHALAGIPEERVRYHMCWGSWHGPHLTDIPLRDIVDLLLTIRAGAYSLEAGNVRHEHEWKVWRDVKLPDGKTLIPGVVSHATNVVEHPELVADRIVQYAQLVGRENVIAGTDCGLGGRIHASLAWAKLRSLVEGAKLASRQLFA